MTTHPESPNPLKISAPLTSVFSNVALLAALQLELFTALGEDHLTVEQLAARMRVGPRRLLAVLNVLVILGLLRNEDGSYANGVESSYYLVKGKPSYIGGSHELFADLYQAVLCTAASIRENRPVAKHDFRAMNDLELGAFFRGLHGLGVFQGCELARQHDWTRFRKLADVGGGSGNVAIGACQTCPELQAIVLEVGRVVPIAKQFIAEAGLENRITSVECDVTQELPSEVFDIAVLRNFVQVLSPQDAEQAIQNVAQTIRTGGEMYIIGYALDDDRRSPWEAAAYDVVFANIYDAGQSYTDGQYRSWLEKAGCGNIERRLLRNNMSLITARIL
jgi:SAM-dependent methyltransferase